MRLMYLRFYRVDMWSDIFIFFYLFKFFISILRQLIVDATEIFKNNYKFNYYDHIMDLLLWIHIIKYSITLMF
jgi:hypothetical protein